MSSEKLIIVLMAVLACYAGLALSASMNGKEVNQVLSDDPTCDTCMYIVSQAKTNLKDAKQQLLQMCNACGRQDYVDKCRKWIEDNLDKIEKMSSTEICQMLGFCRNSQLADIFNSIQF